MKGNSLLSLLLCLGFVLLSGCASMQTTSVYDRKSETRMMVIQEKVEDGLQSGMLAPDQARMYLATLKDIQTEYTGSRGKNVSREEMNGLQGRLDVLEKVTNKALTPPRKKDQPKESFWERVGQDMGILSRTEKVKAPTRGERIAYLQKKIDDGRSGGAFSLAQGAQFQAKLDYIRSEYLRMLAGGGSAETGEREVISRLLDSLEGDLEQIPRL